jgi:protein-tyrosine phosphatase
VIDLHSHLLPGVDDGSRTVEQSVGVLRRMAERGITDVCLTPHLRANETRNAPPVRHDEAFAALRAEAPELPRLHRGAEVMLDRPLALDSDRMRRISLGGTRYVLVSFPGWSPPMR